MSKQISIIVAATPKGEIGAQNQIPWRLNGDLKRFKELTMNNVVIMGRKTFESLPGPLNGRRVIVVTSEPEALLLKYQENDDIYAANSLADAIALANADAGLFSMGNKIFIAGGASIYEEALNADFPCKLELTTVYKKPLADYDTVIPNFNISKFKLHDDKVVPVFELDKETGQMLVSHTYGTYWRE